MNVLPAIFERLDSINKALAAFGSGNSKIINPLKDEAQNGSGAENREPSDK